MSVESNLHSMIIYFKTSSQSPYHVMQTLRYSLRLNCVLLSFHPREVRLQFGIELHERLPGACYISQMQISP